MKMKKIMALALVVLVVLGVFTACGDKKETTPAAGGAATGEEKKVLVMATEPTFPPYNYMQGTDVVGIDTDIAMEIAKEHGWELKIEAMDFDAIIPTVKNGAADFGAAGISVTEDRKKEVDFTVEYATSVQVILLNEGSDVKSIDDLDGKTVGVQLGTVSDLVLQDDYPNIKLLQNKKYTDLALELKNNKIDAIILDNLPAEALVSKNEGFFIAEEEFLTDAYAFVVKKENKELLDAINITLERLMKEGKIVEYTKTHLGE